MSISIFCANKNTYNKSRQYSACRNKVGQQEYIYMYIHIYIYTHTYLINEIFKAVHCQYIYR